MLDREVIGKTARPRSESTRLLSDNQ